MIHNIPVLHSAIRLIMKPLAKINQFVLIMHYPSVIRGKCTVNTAALGVVNVTENPD
jgi:hypothetical protein